MSVNHTAQSSERPPMPTDGGYDDEISLVDLGLVLWRRRRAVLTTVAVVTALGVLWALLLPKQYAYTTTVELGSHVEDGKTVPIEPPPAVLAKISESYIPLALRDYREQAGDEAKKFEVDARVPKDSQLIILESEGKADQAPKHRQVQEQVAATLIDDHSRMFNLLRSGIELEKQRAQRGLDELKDRERFLLADLKRLDLTGDLLRQQIEDTNSLIEAAVKHRAQAIREANDEARAMTLLMLDNEVQQNRARLADLEERFQVGLAQRRDDLNNKLRDNQRQQGIQDAAIQRLELRMQNLLETRAVVTGMQSLEPVGLSRAAIAVLGAFLGGFLGLLAAFGLEFRDRFRIALDETSSEPVAAEVTDVVK